MQTSRNIRGYALALAPLLLLACDTADGAGSTSPADAGDLPTDSGAGSEDNAEPTDLAGDPAEEDANDEAVEPVDEGPVRILFIGNSYTQYNQLPEVVAAFAEASGTPVEVEAVVSGGARLSDHWTDTGARERIAEGDFDFVVIQGQSVEPLTDPETFDDYAHRFADAADEAGAQAVWFATWSRGGGDLFYERAESGFYPLAMTNRLEERYEAAALWHQDEVARVGRAWELALGFHPEIALHADDRSHPTPAGTLLAAGVIAQMVLLEPPALPDPVPLEVPDEEAAALAALIPRVRCPQFLTICGGECLDMSGDRNNCGGCGVTCEGFTPCIWGECRCPLGLTFACPDRCYNLQTDPDNCGACGFSCGDGGLSCLDGECGCPARGAQKDVDYEGLAALGTGCTGNDDALAAECHAAAHAHCAELAECYRSGFGPANAPPIGLSVVCLPDAPMPVTYAELATFDALCDGVQERVGPDCSAAAHRYCQGQGALAGLGPVPRSQSEALVTCLDDVTLGETDYATLGIPLGCNGVDTRWGQTCTAASWLWCRFQGHDAGFGPVETDGDDVTVVCFDF